MDVGIKHVILPSIHSVLNLVQLFIMSSICESVSWLYDISSVVKVESVTSKGVGNVFKFLLRYRYSNFWEIILSVSYGYFWVGNCLSFDRILV